MIIKGCASSLAQASKDLSIEWTETKAHCRDAKAREFAGEYLDEIPAQIAKAVEAMGELERALRKVRSECE